MQQTNRQIFTTCTPISHKLNMLQATLQPTQSILPIIGTITHYRSRSSNRFSLALMHQSIALCAVTIYRPETQINKLKLTFSESLAFVWLLSWQWEKWQNSDKNWKISHSDVIRALRYWNSPPFPPPPGLSGELSIGLVVKPLYFSRFPGQVLC